MIFYFWKVSYKSLAFWVTKSHLSKAFRSFQKTAYFIGISSLLHNFSIRKTEKSVTKTEFFFLNFSGFGLGGASISKHETIWTHSKSHATLVEGEIASISFNCWGTSHTGTVLKGKATYDVVLFSVFFIREGQQDHQRVPRSGHWTEPDNLCLFRNPTALFLFAHFLDAWFRSRNFLHCDHKCG